MGYHPWGRKESDTTELPIHTHSGEVSDHAPVFSPLTHRRRLAVGNARRARVKMPASGLLR